jgi:positive regulator of sigma E activity
LAQINPSKTLVLYFYFLKQDRIHPMSEAIRHKAYVKHVNADSLLVTIISRSACSACHARGACTIADRQEKEVEITRFTKTYQQGEEVTILFKESSGLKALFFGYLVPLLMLITALVISLRVTQNEGISGLISLGILIPYYSTLYFFRHHVKKMFQFEIEETN